MDSPRKIYLVWGGGVSGKAVISYLKEKNAPIICVDRSKTTLEQDPFFQGISLYSENETIPWEKIVCLVKSPGISPEHPFLKLVPQETEVLSEIELACGELKKRGKKLFAITGSNGKTTTTLLTEHLMLHAGIKAKAVGNVGVPLISQINEDIDVFLIELSSFQIEMLRERYFHAGAILNLTPNHLDRYSSFEAYRAAKFKLASHLLQDAPFYLGDGLSAQNAIPIEHVDSINFLSPHDYDNFCAAYTFCKLLGISIHSAKEGLASFKKPAHRQEFVRKWKGIQFINDSKATSVDAVKKALQAHSNPLILIAGGVDKGGDFREWSASMKHVKAVVAMGPAAGRLQQELSPFVSVYKVVTLQDAFELALENADEGDTILLSPGCSSYDQFRNYEQRGDVFKQFVMSLDF